MAVAKNRSLMGKEPFESFFQEGLKNHEIEVDTQSIWEGIEPSLPPASSTATWPWWGLAGLLILAGSVWVIFQDFGQEAVGTHAVAEYEDFDNASPTTLKSTSEQEINVNQQGQKKETGNGPETTEMGLLASAGDVAQIPTEASIAGQTDEDKSRIGVQESLVRSQKKINGSGDVGRISSIILPDQEESGGANPVDLVSTEREEIATDNKIASSGTGMTHDDMAFSESEISETSNALTKEMSVMRMKYSELESLRPQDELGGVTWVSAAPNIMPPKGLDCYDFRSWSLAWSVDAYAGFHYAGKTLSDNGGEVNDYIQARENTESYLEAFDAGLTVNVMHRKGYLASVGINYSQINEKFNFFTVTSTTRFDSVPIRINIDSAGMADTIKAWRPITVQSTEERLSYNSYRMVDIPIALGYHFFNGKWSYEVRAGVMFNLLFQQKGEILNDQLVATNIESGDIFRSQVGLSVFGGIKILYPVNKRFSAFVEPVGRVNLKPITVDSYALTQRYNQFGLRIGARLHL